MSGRPVVFAAFALALAVPASAGTVQHITTAHSSVAVGQAVTATVTGTNPCGAAYIDWGDGTAITYAITGLPTAQSHPYAKAGRYTLHARGMGNCDGEASTSIEITGPPAPPPPEPTAGAITTVQFAPSPAIVRQPVTIAVDGHGPCSFVVEYGDGNRQDFSGVLPKRIEHTYAVAGTYRVIVGPVAPCTGKFTEPLDVLARGGTSIRGITVAPAPAQVRQSVTITVIGSGTCGYTITFGDGNTEERTKPLPDRVTHVYSAPDTYTITVQSTSGCTGSARRALTVFSDR